MAEIYFSALKNKSLWFEGKKTNSPMLINSWFEIFNKAGLGKVERGQKINYDYRNFSYSKIVRFPYLFEIIIATHINLRRLTSGTKFGFINLLIKSVGVSLGFIVLLTAVSGQQNNNNIIDFIVLMPIWILIEVSLTRMSISVVNDKGLMDKLKISHVNSCVGIFLTAFVEYIFTLIITFPISLFLDSDLAIEKHIKILFIIPMSFFIVLALGLVLSIKFSNQRDQKFVIPILMKGALVLTPFIPLVNEFQSLINILIYLNPFSLIFFVASVNNLTYDLSINFLLLSYFLTIGMSTSGYLILKKFRIVIQREGKVEIRT